MSEQRIRWGLLSTARINERLIPAIRAVPRADVVAVASRSREKAEAYARTWEIPRAYGRYEDLLADPDIDAVYIGLPNGLHEAWSVKAAEAGKHILCEKPLAVTPEQVDRMADAAGQHGVVLQEAAMYRFHPQTLQLRERIAQGAIGAVRSIQCSFGFTLSNLADIRLDPALGGGALWDVGSYPVSFIRTMMGAEPVEVAAWQIASDRGVDLSFAGQMRFASGALAQFTCSFQTITHWAATLVGSEGIVRLDLPWQNVIGATAHVHIRRKGQARKATFGDSTDFIDETITYEDCNAYVHEVEGMTASILDGVPSPLPVADSRRNVAALAALYTAARENRVVRPAW